ncbi:MAG TPA: pitrilysin family protein [Bryobacteraceae bacterium]|nr:pitrilysin family protein [Bryobacteraceae bacterium]
MTLRNLTTRVAIVLGILAAAVPAMAQDEFKEIESRVNEFTLANGWKFIVLERHQAPVAAFFTYADVGATQEVTGYTGLAHLFEHMAFKGSSHIGTNNAAAEKDALAKVDLAYDALRDERRKGDKADPAKLKKLDQDFKDAQDAAGNFVVPNEYGEAIERAGGRGLNANTTSDATNYFFSLPSNEAELWFYLEGQRFGDPVLREFYKERNVVMEERRLNESQPVGRLVEEFQAAAYKAHPYHEPVLGHMSDLLNLTRADGAAFFKKYYVPSNLTSVVVGDVTLQRVRELAERYFASIPAGQKEEPLRTVEPPQTGERRVTLRLQSQRVFVEGYHKPDINDPDNAVYDAIGSLLSEGRSSRLYRSLVRDKKIATTAGGFPGFPGEKYPGLFLFYAFTAQGHTNAEVQKAIEAEIERLKTEPVSQEELDGVKRRTRAGIIRELDDNSTLARTLAASQVLTGDWRTAFTRLGKMAAVTPADIQRVSKAIFVFDNRTVAEIEPLSK